MRDELMVIWSNALPGTDDAFNAWYTDQHLADLLNIPGVSAAQRFQRSDPVEDGGHRYLAIYELTDPASVRGEIPMRAGTEAMPISPALDRSGVQSTFLSAQAPRAADDGAPADEFVLVRANSASSDESGLRQALSEALGAVRLDMFRKSDNQGMEKQPFEWTAVVRSRRGVALELRREIEAALAAAPCPAAPGYRIESYASICPRVGS